MLISTPRDGRPVVLSSRVRQSRRLWAGLFLGQLALAATVLVLLAADDSPGQWWVAPRAVAVDVMVLAMGVALAVLHRRHPGLVGDANRDRARYGRNVLLPTATLAAACLFGLAVMFVTGEVWPAAVVPAASMAAQLTVRPEAG